MITFWLNQQEESGLIQQGVDGYSVCADLELKHGKNPKFFRFDPQTDFFVDLMRAHQLTGKSIYKTKALKLLDGMCNYHSHKSGFTDILDENKNKLNYLVETKFLFLILKALMYESYEKKKIYKDEKIKSLLRDR